MTQEFTNMELERMRRQEFLDEAKERLTSKKIVGTDTMLETLYYVGHTDCWEFFEYIVNNMRVTHKAFGRGLALAYTGGRADDLFQALEYFQDAQLKYLCTPKELAYLNSLEDEVTIYRGGYKFDEWLPFGLSWSLDRGVAEFFAFRGVHFPKGMGVVISTKVSKSRFLALFLERGEFEVIININTDTDSIAVETYEPTKFYYDFEEEKKLSLQRFMRKCNKKKQL